jgi:hypothetical protein
MHRRPRKQGTRDLAADERVAREQGGKNQNRERKGHDFFAAFSILGMRLSAKLGIRTNYQLLTPSYFYSPAPESVRFCPSSLPAKSFTNSTSERTAMPDGPFAIHALFSSIQAVPAMSR